MSATKASMLMAFAGLFIWQLPSALAADCPSGCSLQRRTCIGVARVDAKTCRATCKNSSTPVPECRRNCANAYRFAKLLCKQGSSDCRDACQGADGSCASDCGGPARTCFEEVRATARSCRRDCKQTARSDRAQCKIDFPQDPGACLEQVGAAQSACLDNCGAAQEAGYQSCRDTFDGCLDGCPPPDVPPKVCNDLSGGLQIIKARKTKDMGYTTVSWNSNFAYLGHVCGDPITLDEGALEIVVEAGVADFVEFVDNKTHPFTPLSPDPATGTITPGSTVTVVFDGLHYDATCDYYVGNSHFKVLMRVDKNGDGVVESDGYLGTNIHVEAEADCP